MRTIYSMKPFGTKGIPLVVECKIDQSHGVGIHLIGLADSAMKESLLRTVTALQSNGFRIPGKRIIINLAPADLRKSGNGYDLPIALAVIAESNQVSLNGLEEWLAIGELGLDGSVREVPGCVQAVQAAIDAGCKGVIIPKGNVPEVAKLFQNKIPVCGVANLHEALCAIGNPDGFKSLVDDYVRAHAADIKMVSAWDSFLGDRRAIEIAAAGGHHVLLVGPIGSGRCTFARALTEILPVMSSEEILDVAAVYSVAGRGMSRVGLDQMERPFRSPHVSASLAAMIGGGNGDNVLPGEVALAHNGVLYIDEINNMPNSLGEALKCAIIDKKVVISRLKSKVAYPADFQFVGTLDSCPCGHYGDGDHCLCPASQRRLWWERLKQSPLYPSIDMHVWVKPLVNLDLTPQNAPKRSEAEDIAGRVICARQMQAQRYSGDPSVRLNRDLGAADVDIYCHLDDECSELLNTITERLGLSATSRLHILRIARTIADLDLSKEIKSEHIAEASSWRFLDRESIGL